MHTPAETDPPRAPSGAAPGEAADKREARVVASADLLQGQRSVDILHNGAVYRLQETRFGKLILTK
jgi:hemin uptake protein HemP